MEAVAEKTKVITDMKKRISDVQMIISWRDFANTYFQRSSSWFYHKMDGIDGNGARVVSMRRKLNCSEMHCLIWQVA